MLTKIANLTDYRLRGRDEEFGVISDFLFDDVSWCIRYIVVESGSWLVGRQVLLTPHTLGTVDNECKTIDVSLTRKEIEESPSLGTHRPVSRQFEQEYHTYYGFPAYWGEKKPGNVRPEMITDISAKLDLLENRDEECDPHLRSTENVRGYHVDTLDGGLGHVGDFVVDDVQWKIPFLILVTKNWWPGNQVLIGTNSIASINWRESKIVAELSRQFVVGSPEYNESVLQDPEYIATLNRYYGLSESPTLSAVQ